MIHSKANYMHTSVREALREHIYAVFRLQYEKFHTVLPITSPTTLRALARASALAMVANAAPGYDSACR